MALVAYPAAAGALAVAYHFPMATGATFFAGLSLWLVYLHVLCIKPSRRPRRSSLADAPMRAKTYPPSYPNGWFHLIDAAIVKAGEVVQVDGLGRRFAVWRSASGELSVLDGKLVLHEYEKGPAIMGPSDCLHSRKTCGTL